MPIHTVLIEVRRQIEIPVGPLDVAGKVDGHARIYPQFKRGDQSPQNIPFLLSDRFE
jgi:hypothetical protein